MRSVTLRHALVVALCLGPVSQRRSWGWGDNGHIAVAKIADAFLSTKAKREIASLLGGTPIYARRICVYADMFRNTPRGRHTKPWHYVDIPTDQPGYDAARDCAGKDCVVAQIVEQGNILKDEKAARADRIDALKFLVHFVGDVHQPLHCAERSHDHGGNDVSVRVLDGVGMTNLHAAWDSDILDENLRELDPEEYADEIRPRISDSDRSAWEASTDPVQWANEGHAAAVAYAYKDVPSPDGRPFRLDQAYVDRAKPVVEKQIQKAGVRLAKLLNELLN